MRRARMINWWTENQQFIDVCLAADYTAEHEYGIGHLEEIFGIPGAQSEVNGLPKRTISKSSPLLSLLKVGAKLYLHLGRYQPLAKKDLKHESELFLLKGGPTAGAAWDAKSFGIVTSDKQSKTYLKDLKMAFETNDIAIYVGASGPFENGGLCILIASRVPESMRAEMLAADEDAAALTRAVEKTGIKEELRRAGKGWYALNPKWSKEIVSTVRGELRTSFPVVFWLNPADQKHNEHGWFSVEELRLWALGQGPCIKADPAKI